MFHRYRKARGALQLKRHKGTFSLSNQVVLNRRTREVSAGVKVLGISVHNGVRRGYIRTSDVHGLYSKRVEQLGAAAWSTIDMVDEARNRKVLTRAGIL